MDRMQAKRRLNAFYITLRDKSSSSHQTKYAQQEIDKLLSQLSKKNV